MVRVAAAVLLAFLLLSGCSTKSEPEYDAVIDGTGADGVPVEIPPEPILTEDGGVGSLAGLVVDTLSKPLNNATVVLVGTGLASVTSKNGTFTITDLAEGTYGAIASYKGLANATGTVIIRDGVTTRAWFQLKPLPPPPPYHRSIFINGTVMVTTDPLTGTSYFTCSRCTTSMVFDPYMASLIVEARMELDGPIPVRPFPDPLDLHNQTFYFSFDGYSNSVGPNWWAWGGNPLWARSDQRMGGNYRFDFTPGTYPTPETNREFEVVITAFYVDRAPEAWSHFSGSR